MKGDAAARCCRQALLLSTAFAALTKRIEIGMMVTCNSYRNPQLLADTYRRLGGTGQVKLLDAGEGIEFSGTAAGL